jgi:hypothetical protein
LFSLGLKLMRDEEIAGLEFTGWPAPDEFLVEVGRIAVLWAGLESLLNICLGKLAGFNDRSDPKPFILIAHSSFPQRLDTLGALCEQVETEFPQLEGYKKVVSQLKAAQASRNRFMHHGFSYNPESKQMEMAVGSARGKLKMAVEPVTLEDIKRVSIEIDEANRALYKLVLRRDFAPSWTRKRA